MTERFCHVDTNRTNADRADRERPGKRYARVYVDVAKVSGNTVTLRVPPRVSSGETNTQLKEVDLVWDAANVNVWMECPSTLASSPQQPPAIGASGYLYLENAFLKMHGIAGDPKWPVAMPDDPVQPSDILQPLRIFPTSIVIAGHELSTGQQRKGSIDLLDKNLASQLQIVELDLGRRRIELLLTQQAFTRFLVPWPPAAPAAAALPEQAADAEIRSLAEEQPANRLDLTLTVELPQGGTVTASTTATGGSRPPR